MSLAGTEERKKGDLYSEATTDVLALHCVPNSKERGGFGALSADKRQCDVCDVEVRERRRSALLRAASSLGPEATDKRLRNCTQL